jgi:hypothetical protein
VCNLLIPDFDAGVFAWNIDPDWKINYISKL